MRNPILQFFALITTTLLMASWVQAQDRLKPFVMASQTDAPFEEVVSDTYERLTDSDFRVIGEYRPYASAAVLVITRRDLQTAALETDTSVWIAALRVAITENGDVTEVSYVNPPYLAAAYRLEQSLDHVTNDLASSLGTETTFGSNKGLTAKSLGKYRYMFGMERVDDTYDLAQYPEQAQAVAAVSAGLADASNGVTEIYRLNLDGDTLLLGVAMSGGGDDDNKYWDDSYQMSVVDFQSPRQTAYLPYEILIRNGNVSALHMRYRMALHFPDLSMMGKHSFMTLMPSPDAIGKALKEVAEGVGDSSNADAGPKSSPST